MHSHSEVLIYGNISGPASICGALELVVDSRVRTTYVRMGLVHYFAFYMNIILVYVRTVQLQNDQPYLQTYPKTDGRTPLHFALMLSFGGDYTSIGALPGVQIALDYINNEPSILPGYTLHYTLTDSQVHVFFS